MRKISADDMAGMDISGYDEGHRLRRRGGAGNKDCVRQGKRGVGFQRQLLSRSHTAALSRLGIKTGAYHFFRFYQVSTAQAQAENFLECITGVRLDCAPAVDCEDGGLACGLSAEEATGQVLDFARAVEQATGARPIFYSNTAFISAHFTRDIARLGAWIADLRDPAGPGENGVTDDWVGFQYSFCGSVGGKTVDLDRFRPGVLLASPLCLGSGAAQAPAEPSRPECDPAASLHISASSAG
jgi:lysozyme